MIARYEVLMARRRVARERLVLDEDVIAKLAEEGAQEMPLRHRQLDALDRCVAKLPEERRKLALAAYGTGVSMKERMFGFDVSAAVTDVAMMMKRNRRLFMFRIFRLENEDRRMDLDDS